MYPKICPKIRVLTAAVPENLGTDVLRAKGGVAICAMVPAIYCFPTYLTFLNDNDECWKTKLWKDEEERNYVYIDL
jgi:hypothetical protein